MRSIAPRPANPRLQRPPRHPPRRPPWRPASRPARGARSAATTGGRTARSIAPLQDKLLGKLLVKFRPKRLPRRPLWRPASRPAQARDERREDRAQERDGRTRQGDADARRREERFAPGVTINVGREAPRIDELRGLRRERTEGGRVIIEEPGDRRIIREGNRTVIIHDETDRFRRAYGGSDVRTERRGREEVTIVRRPNGIEIVTVRDDNGDLIRRVRRESGRRDVVLIENEVRGGPRRTIVEEIVELPPLAIRIPREKYVVEVERASQEDLYEAFTAPPVERIDRSYTLEEIRRSPSLRERVRRVDVDTVTFDFGSWTLAPEQVGALTGVANAIRRSIERNPDEIFLIEGHTDAVGNDIDNLTLVGPARRDRGDGPVGELPDPGREPDDAGLRRAVSEGQHAGRRAREPARHDPAHHAAAARPRDGERPLNLKRWPGDSPGHRPSRDCRRRRRARRGRPVPPQPSASPATLALCQNTSRRCSQTTSPNMARPRKLR